MADAKLDVAESAADVRTNITNYDYYQNSMPQRHRFNVTHAYIDNLLDISVQNPYWLLFVCVYAVTFVVGLLGNALVIFTMTVDKSSRSNITSTFLISLAAADLLMVLVVIPYQITSHVKVDFNISTAVCRFVQLALTLSPVASVLNLTVHSVERFEIIVYPMKSRTLCTMKIGRKILLCTWLGALGLSAPVIFVRDVQIYEWYDEHGLETVTTYCEYVATPVTMQLFAVYRLLVMFAIPAAIMFICYAVVIRVLWISTKKTAAMMLGSVGQEKKRLRSHCGRCCMGRRRGQPAAPISNFRAIRNGARSNAGTSSSHAEANEPASRNLMLKPTHSMRSSDDTVLQARKQVIKMLIAVVVVFVLCWAPKLIFDVMLRFASIDAGQGSFYVKVLTEILPLAHSCFNPLIYAFVSRNFRHSMTRAFMRISRHSTRGQARPSQYEMNSMYIYRPTSATYATTNNRATSVTRTRDSDSEKTFVEIVPAADV